MQQYETNSAAVLLQRQGGDVTFCQALLGHSVRKIAYMDKGIAKDCVKKNRLNAKQ